MFGTTECAPFTFVAIGNDVVFALPQDVDAELAGELTDVLRFVAVSIGERVPVKPLELVMIRRQKDVLATLYGLDAVEQ